MSTISRPVSRTVTVDHGGNAGGCIVVEPADHVLVQVVGDPRRRMAELVADDLMSMPLSSAIDAAVCRASRNRMTGSSYRRASC